MFESLSKAIDRKKYIWSKEKISNNQKIFNCWEKIIIDEYGPEMITLARPYSFKHQKLTVTVRNSTVACEIQAKKEKIKNIINKNTGGETKIKEIIIKIS
jgi:hypothetical protein